MGSRLDTRVGLLALLVTLAVVALQRVVTTTYVLNFSTAGPNATALLVVFVVTGWTVPLVPRLWRSQRAVTAAFGVLVAATLLSTAHAPLLALVGALGVLAVGTPLAAGLQQQLRARTAVAGALGVALFLSLRAWLDTAPAYVTLPGRVLLVGFALGALALWLALSRTTESTSVDRDLSAAPVPLVAFLWLAATYFATPAALATWAGRSYPLTAIAAVTGLATGALLVSRRGVPDDWETVGWVVVFVAAAAALLWTDLVAGVSALPAHAAAVVLLARGSATARARSIRRVAGGVAGLQVVALLLLFLHIGALNWAFMPAPVDTLTRGRLSLFLFGLWLLLPATVAVSVLRDRDGPETARELQPSADPNHDRRAVLGVATAGLLGLAGVAGRASLADTPSGVDGDLTVMTYNVHQFLEPGGDYSHEAIADVIAAEDPDVVGIQETESGRLTSGAHDGVRWLANELGYHYTYGTTTSAGSYGVALLSRWPIRDERVVYMPVANSPPYPALVAELDTPQGLLPVVVTHFQTQRPGHRQAEEAELVVELASDYDRTVVLGDFNVRPDSDEAAYRIMAETFVDAWRAAESTSRQGDTYSAADPRKRIDYVWVTDDWTVATVRTAGRPAASDHLAVVATLDEP